MSGRERTLPEARPLRFDLAAPADPILARRRMQQICHALRTQGDTTFEEISNVVPWLETCEDIGVDVNGEQVCKPRLFKTHAWRPHLKHTSKEAKYILITRDPVDSAISFYNFLNGWFFKKDTISIDTFLTQFFLKRGKPATIMNNPSYWEFLLSWWPHRKDENVLWLWYEDMKENHREVVVRVADFLGFDSGDSDLVDLVTSLSTFDYMKKNERHFDEHTWKERNNVRCGLEATASMETSKVMNGGRKPKPKLSAELVDLLHQKWRDVVTPQTGMNDYEELRASFP